VAGLSTALAKLGAEPVVITHAHAGQPEDDEFEGVKVKRLKGFVMPRLDRAISAGLARRLHEHIKFGNFDVIHGQDIYSSMALLSIHSARKRKIPSVLTCHSIHKSSGFWKLVYQPVVFTMKRANCIIVVSSASREFCIKLGVPNHKIVLAPNGVDLSKFNPDIDGSLLRGRLGLENEPLVVTAIRLVKRKGPEHLVVAFSKVLKNVPDAKLAIAGKGPEMDNLRVQIKKLGIEKSAFMLGALSHAKVAELMAAANVFVLPSVMESFPLTAVEAMAVGVPIVCPRVGGVPEIITEGFNGLMFPPADNNALADAIVHILKDQPLAKRLRENGLKTVREKFSWEAAAKRTLGIYEMAREKYA
jgi:glycosyltransferase involved in cell wall biosynthesis